MRPSLFTRGVLAIVITLFVLLGALQAAAQEPCKIDTQAAKVAVTGNVTDPTGAAVSGANVSLRCGGFRQDARSTGDGSYSTSVPPGSYQVEIDAAGFEPVTKSVTVSAGASQKLDLSLAIKRAASIVTVTAPTGYVATSATTATKSDIPLIETPQSVSVITQDQMTSRNTQTLGEVIRYTSSVGVDAFGTETRFDWFNIRGFDESTYGLFRDNSRWQSGQVQGQVDPYELQEVDVIKGPSSVLYGQNTPGGLVNLVTKRPQSEAAGELVVNFGAYDRKQVQGDVGGPIDKDAHWRYRLTGLERASNTQVNYVPDDRRFLAPALTWAPSNRTTFTALTDYQYDNTGWSQFLPAEGTFLPNPNGVIPTSFFTGEPGYDYFHRQQWSTGYLFEHRFENVWSIRQTSRYSKIVYDGQTAFGVGYDFAANDQRTLDRFGFGNNLNLGLYTVDTQAAAQFKTGSIGHQFLFGVDYSHADSKTRSAFAGAPPIDVFDPVYGQLPFPLFTYLHTDQPSWQTGLYFQDHINLTRRLVVTLSGREDWTDSKTLNLLSAAPTQEQTPHKFTGRTGITYLTNIGIAPYFSYSTSFLPTAGVDFFGKAFQPTTGTQYEGGFKYQPKKSESFITASYFTITQDNVLTPDLATGHQNFQVQTGAVRSRGFEIEGVASVLHGLNLHTAYSWLSQEVTSSNDPTTLGKRPILSPDRLFSISADYTVTRGGLTGLGGNFGVRYVGSSAGDPVNTFVVPAYTLVDASARYDFKRLRFQVNATNLADKRYVAVCESNSYCNYGYRRNVIGSIRYRWSSWGEFLR